MNSSVIFVLATALIIIVSVFLWVMLHRYGKHLSRIDKELHDILVMLGETPKETSLKEYMFAQDQQLRGIADKLKSSYDTDILQQCIQDQANQVIAFISTHSEDSNSRITSEDLKVSLQSTHELLERVLWSLRFDEDKYLECAVKNTNTSKDKDKKNASKLNTQSAISNNKDNVSIESFLENSDDDYGAMLKYMQHSGKSGVEAQQALKAAKVMRGRA
jgi:hypothetical protein